ncbi:hypothetical protein ANCCAN_05897 [Ancylostoma caninum]|uniref:Uncharacterized protein n=1 Tax=Ancylostoma caninum TaxID=29170 RepID=A0A368GUM7_ANCCA|nr:hypothetical protein ANCCAN_05897 [Ancylostoma caninum]
MRSILIALCFVVLVSPWVIYRRSHKKRLICKEEPDETQNSTLLDDSAEEQPMTAARRLKRDVEVDPVHKQPIIYLGVGLLTIYPVRFKSRPLPSLKSPKET